MPCIISLAKAGLKEREGKRERESKLESSPSLSFSCLSAYAIFASIKWNWNFGQVPLFPLRKESMSTNYHSYLIFLFNALIIGQIATPKAFRSSPGTQSRCPMAATCSGDDLCPIKNWASKNVSPCPPRGEGVHVPLPRSQATELFARQNWFSLLIYVLAQILSARMRPADVGRA